MPISKYELSVISYLPVPVTVVDQDSAIVFINAAMERLTGYTLAEVVDQRAPYPWWMAETSMSGNDFRKAVRESSSLMEDAFRNREGNPLFIRLASSPVEIEGRLRHYLTCWHDITAIRKIEAALLESEERSQRLSDAASEGVIIHDNLIIIDANRAYATMHGYDVDEVIGMNELELVAPQERDAALQSVVSGDDTPHERLHLRKDGSIFYVEATGKNGLFRGKAVRIATYRDISERKRMEGELLRSEEEFRVIFEAAIEGIVVCNHSGYIVQANKAAADMLGYRQKEGLLGRSLLAIFVGKDHARALRDRKRAIRESSVRTAEYTCFRKGGSEFEAEASIALLPEKVERQPGFVVVIRDITERKKHQDELRFYISQLTRVQEEERERISRELHDDTIQSLSALSLELQAFISKGGSRLSEGALEWLNQLVYQLAAVIKNVRRFTHDLKPDILDRLGLMPALDLLVQEFNGETAIKAFLEVAGCERRLPSETELALFRIAQEGLHNIRKHSQAAQGLVRMEFQPGKVRLIIKDDGKGFSPEEMQVSRASRGQLGIISMQERAHLIGAEFSLESRIGAGTTISVELEQTA